MRGRHAKPLGLAIAQGDPRAKHRTNEPQAPINRPVCPDWLSLDQKAEWDDWCRDLEALKVLSAVDGKKICAAALASDRMKRAVKMIEETGGEVLQGGNGFYQNPWLAVLNKAVEQVVKIGAEFGLDPTSRSRVRVSEKQVGEKTGIAKFIG